MKGLRAKTEVWAHSCWGNPSAQRMFASVQTYKPALEAYNTVDADVITFESSASGGIDLEAIGKIITENKDIKITKVAMEPVWYLPGIAKRLKLDEGDLRRILFQESGGMYPELITRPDLKTWLPPIGSSTAYIFGDPRHLSDTAVELTCRVHDECNLSLIHI